MTPFDDDARRNRRKTNIINRYLVTTFSELPNVNIFRVLCGLTNLAYLILELSLVSSQEGVSTVETQHRP